jgi:hypothetical protein
MNVCELVFAATTTLTGTGIAAALLLIKLTVTPPAGALPLNCTVPVAPWPLVRLLGLKVSCVTTGARIVSVLVFVLPLSEAVSVATICDVTGTVGTPNTTLVAPAGIVTVEGTRALPLLLEICTVIPPVGAGPPRVTVI